MDKNIFLKTLKLFGNKGIRFTTEDLAKELGTSKRTIYSNFSSKDEIIEKTIDFVFSGLFTTDNEIISNSELSIQDKIKQCFKNVPDAYSLGSIVRHMDDLQRYYPALWEKVNNHLDNTWNPIVQLIEEGIRNKEIEKIDTTILNLMLNQTLKKLLDYEYLAKNQVSFDSGFEAMINIILYGLIKRKDG